MAKNAHGEVLTPDLMVKRRSSPGAFTLGYTLKDDHYVIALRSNVMPKSEVPLTITQLGELAGLIEDFAQDVSDKVDEAALAYDDIQKNKGKGWFGESSPASLLSFITTTRNEIAKGWQRILKLPRHMVRANAERQNVLVDRVTLDDLTSATKRYIEDREGAPCLAQKAAVKKAEAALGYDVDTASGIAQLDVSDKNEILDHMTDFYAAWRQGRGYEQRLDARELLADLHDHPGEWTREIERDIVFLQNFTKAWEKLEQL